MIAMQMTDEDLFHVIVPEPVTKQLVLRTFTTVDQKNMIVDFK